MGLYGIPYLLPDAVMADLGAERSHTSVLAAAAARIRADAAVRGIDRTVAIAHAFVTGAVASQSERDIRVGGIGDAPASVFDGFSYVALGHLHGPQQIRAGGSATTIRYSGSPLAFSFSERTQAKSVTLAEIDAAGQVAVTQLPAPVPRPLREVRGKIDDLLARADGDLADLAGAWVKVVLTDTVRPAGPDGAAAREVAAHPRRWTSPRRAGRPTPTPTWPAGRGRRPGGDLRAVRRVHQRGAARPGPAASAREAVEAAQHAEAAA